MLRIRSSALVFLFCLLAFLGCKQKKETLFTLLDDAHSQIDFVNEVEESEEYNITTYEYLYNGGGVAAADFNNDGLTDLIFTGNAVHNKLYLNKGNLEFDDITEKAGVSGRKKWKTGVTVADVNNDGLPDIYVCYSGPGTDEDRANQLFINNGGNIPTFTEKASEYNLDAAGTYSTQASFFDYDRDGDLDMFLLNHAKITYSPFFNTKKLRAKRHPQYGNRLYENINGKFTDVSEKAGIHGSALNFGLGIAVSDVDNDGWPDIYVTNDYEEQDFFYLNNRDGTFREVLKESMRHISRFGMGCDIADFNNDGLLDLFVVDMLPEDNYRQKVLKGPDEFDKYQLLRDSGYHHQNMRNMLQLNTGKGPGGLPVFSEIGQLAGVSNTDWSWAPLFADFDNDGFKDLFISNGYLRDFTNLDFLKFDYVQAVNAAQKEGKKIKEFEAIKQLSSTKIRNYLLRNNGKLAFENRTEEWGLEEKSISNGTTYADLDNDGDLEIIVNNINEKAFIYKNNSETLLKNSFVKIKLEGPQSNNEAIGAKVWVETDGGKQVQELYPTRGFQSAVSPILNFGTGSCKIIKSLKVIWPDGKITIKKNLDPGKLITISYNEAVIEQPEEEKKAVTLFTNFTEQSGLSFRHRENYFVDYKTQYLIPYQLSRLGPCLVKGDVNGDGNEDVYIGGASGQSGTLFFLKENGGFMIAKSQPWKEDSLSEDTGAAFFDADGDRDLDLYVVSGGSEFSPDVSHLLQDRLYFNDGQGNFSKSRNVLPQETSSGSCVVASDFDKDGDMDLFVGGRVLPGYYPLPGISYLLRNDSENGHSRFTDVTPVALKKPGMVTSAIWMDYDNDGWDDLIVTGEFMPVSIFGNEKGQLVESKSVKGLEHSSGLWCKLISEDIDGDGDLDIIAGNAGLNTQLKASAREPMTMLYGDFNQDGRIDPILSYYIKGKPYPYASKDEMLDQLPVLKQKFVKYESYANATLDDMIPPDLQKTGKVIKTEILASCIIENKGNGVFNINPLPLESQFSMLFGILSNDFDHDGKKDLLLSGNFFPYRVQLGRNDASSGLFLKGEGNGKFKALQYPQTGFYVPGDVRAMVELKTKNNQHIIVAALNDDRVKIFKRHN